MGRNASNLLDFRGAGLVADDAARLGRLEKFLSERLGARIRFDDSVMFGRIDELAGTITLNPKTATFDVLAHEISHVRFARFMGKWNTGQRLTNFEVNLMEAIGYHGTYRGALRSGLSQTQALNEALIGPGFAQPAIQALRSGSPRVLQSLNRARAVYGDDFIIMVLRFEGRGTTKAIPLP